MAKYKECPDCLGKGTEAGGLLSCSRCKGEKYVKIIELDPIDESSVHDHFRKHREYDEGTDPNWG